MTLSNNAQILLSALKKASIWEENAVKVLFPEPIYSKENAAEYWQWDENIHGNGSLRPVNGESVEFKMNVEKNYSDVTYEAFKELRAAGLARATNSGYNTYAFHYTEK